MKSILFYSIAISISTCALASYLSVAAPANEPSNSTSNYAEKKSAAEFWAEFNQHTNQTWQDGKSAFKDGWIESKLETALSLNKHLNPFDIDIRVDGNSAALTGSVHSDIQRELAEQIALGVEGIDKVTNNIKVVKKTAGTLAPTPEKGRSFAQYVTDVSTTAAIKTELLASKNMNGLYIQVETHNDKVILSGTVKSQEEKALAQAIAAKHNDVKGVVNNLRVQS